MNQSDARLAAILAVDIAGFARMMNEDDARALAALSTHHEHVQTTIRAHHGTVLRSDGDAMLLEFATTGDALDAVIALLSQPTSGAYALRIGMHLGDIRIAGGSAYGDGVTTAVALRDRAEPQGACLSDVAWQLVSARTLPAALVHRVAPPVSVPETGRTVAAHVLQPAEHAAGPRPEASAQDEGETLYAFVREMIRRTGARPTRDAVVQAYALAHRGHVPSAEELDVLTRRGLIRRAAADQRDDDARTVASQLIAEGGAAITGGLKRLLSRADLDDAELAEAYTTRFERRLSAQRAGLAAHTTSYIGVNVLITGIWALTGAGFPWFLFPLLGWGIGYVGHRTSVRAREAEYATILGLQAPTRSILKRVRDLWKVRRGWREHLASNGMTMILLATINVITSPGFPWSLIPIGAMSIGLVTHRRTSSIRERQMVQELIDDGVAEEVLAPRAAVGRRLLRGGTANRGASRGAAGTPDATTPGAHARAVRDEILAHVTAVPELTDRLGDDFQSVLDTYVSQIETLAAARAELTSLVESIPIAQLEADYSETTKRIETAADDRMRHEYESHRAQIERQRHSYSELITEQEMLRLRMSSALNALTQLRIDVQRARTTRTNAELSGADALRERSEDLRSYLADLRAAYEELT